MVAGVCGGCAKHFALDVAIVRVVWTLAALVPPLFPGVAAYLVSWFLMPVSKQQPTGESPRDAALASK